jgi:hypothetical protein
MCFHVALTQVPEGPNHCGLFDSRNHLRIIILNWLLKDRQVMG